MLTLGLEGNKINCFPRDQSFSYLFIKFIKPQRRSEINIRSPSVLLPCDVIDFCNVARSEILAGNSFDVTCHVTSK